MSMEGPRNTVQRYYDFINAHDPQGMLGCCSDDVYVTFPEEQRNWRSLEMAKSKFSGMFESLKGFKADWKFEDDGNSTDVQGGGQDLVVRVRARFTAEGYNAQRLMVYTMETAEPFRIRRIDHINV